MVNDIQIHMPIWQLALMAIVPITGFWLAAAWLRRLAVKHSAPGEAPDWSVPPLEAADGLSPVHRWDVRVKIITILLYCFMITALQHLTPALVAIAVSLLVLIIAKAEYYRVVLRLIAISGFVGMFMVVMPFSTPQHGGDTVLVLNGWEWFGFNLRGLRLAATIAAKAVAITLLMEPLIATAPLPTTLHGLSKLGAPDIIGQMVLLSYRYLHVFRHEARRMSTGMQVRGFRKRTNLQTLRAVANFLGMLFVRSFERTERVFDAMQARGYKGHFPEPVELRLLPRDLWMMGGWIVTGILLIAYDRLSG